MKRWSEWRERMRRAKTWEAPRQDDPAIVSLQGLFGAAKSEDTEIGNRVWNRIRPRLRALEEAALSPASLWAGLASAGPRFALGAACAFAIMAGVFLTRPGDTPRTEIAALSPPPIIVAEASATPEEYPLQALEANSGDDLLQFIAYGTPSR